MLENFNFIEVEKILKYNFKNKNLLKLAFTHPSKSENNYEILEFRGDAVLNLIITDAISDKFSEFAKEGKLAKIKAYLVSSEILSTISKDLNLLQYVIMSYGEDISGGRTKDNIAENILEAVIAAIYLDSDFQQVKKFILKLWDKFIIDATILSDNFDPKTKLQEMIYGKYKIYPKYSLIEMQQLPSHHVFKVELECIDKITIGLGKNKKEAEKNAAKEMLKYFN